MTVEQLKTRLLEAIETLEKLEDNLAINRLVEDFVTEVTGAEFSSVWMNEYPLLVRERENGLREVSMEEKRGLLYRTFLTREAAIYNYLTSEKGYVPAIDNPDDIRIKSKIAIPLSVRDHLLGIVTCYSSVRKIKNFTTEDLERFKAITPFVIEAMIKMQKNRGRDLPFDLRSGQSTDIGKRRRLSDLIRKVEALTPSETEDKKEKESADDNRLASIVHDIRTPANNLLGFLTLLEEHIEEKRLREYLEHARKSAELINELTTSILDSVASGQNRKIEKTEVVNSTLFFAEVGKIFSARMYEKRIRYNIFIDPLLPKEIEVDPMRLKRVLMNLIGNAVKFTPEGGIVEYSVRYKRRERQLHIAVMDNGIGIPEEKQQVIFEAFTQADASTKERFGGTGLGLAISAEYVRSMGGELRLESALEKGSTFYFDLPVRIVEDAPKLETLDTQGLTIGILLRRENLPVAKNIARYFVKMGLDVDRIRAVTDEEKLPEEMTHLIVFEHKSDAKSLQRFRQKGIRTMIVEENFLALKEADVHPSVLISQYAFYGEELYGFVAPEEPLPVLIVDDDRISVELIRSMLEEEYCRIEVASDGEEGLRILSEALRRGCPYRLLFTDQNMPRLSGEEMISRYRELEGEDGKHPLITVSISGDPSEKGSGRVFDFYAKKPFNKSEILTIVRSAQHQNQHKE